MPTSASTPRVPMLVPRLDEPSSPLPPPAPARPEPGHSAAYNVIDRSFHAALARWTGGLSPAAVALAFADWQLHLMAAPGKQLALAAEAFTHALQFAEACVPRHPGFEPWSLIKPAAQDHRFVEADWELPAFNILAQWFLLIEQWLHSASTDVSGLSRPNSAVVDFTLRQLLDTVAPSNFLTNPEVLRAVIESGGGNFISGLHNWFEDLTTLATRGG